MPKRKEKDTTRGGVFGVGREDNERIYLTVSKR